jgi:hypothetical protein
VDLEAIEEKNEKETIQFYLNGNLLDESVPILQSLIKFNSMQVIPDDTVTTGDIRVQPMSRTTAGIDRSLWNTTWSLEYEKVKASRKEKGAASSFIEKPSLEAYVTLQMKDDNRISQPIVSDVLRVLKILFVLNDNLRLICTDQFLEKLPYGFFHNSKINFKLLRQAQDALAICGYFLNLCFNFRGTLPDWVSDLITNYPFLFPFDARLMYIHITKFGIPRALHKLQSASGEQDTNFRLGRIFRQKVIDI